MDQTSAMGRVGVNKACTKLRWRYRPAQFEVGKRKEHSFCFTCDYPSRLGTMLSDLKVRPHYAARQNATHFFLKLADTILKPLIYHMLRGFF